MRCFLEYFRPKRRLKALRRPQNIPEGLKMRNQKIDFFQKYPENFRIWPLNLFKRPDSKLYSIT